MGFQTPLQGLGCFVAALPGEEAAALWEKLGEGLCLREGLQHRGASASLPVRDGVIKSTRLRKQLRIIEEQL